MDLENINNIFAFLSGCKVNEMDVNEFTKKAGKLADIYKKT